MLAVTALLSTAAMPAATADATTDAALGEGWTCVALGLEGLAPSTNVFRYPRDQDPQQRLFLEVVTQETTVELVCANGDGGGEGLATTAPAPPTTFSQTFLFPHARKVFALERGSDPTPHVVEYVFQQSTPGVNANHGIHVVCVVNAVVVGVPLVCSVSFAAAVAACWTAFWFIGQLCGVGATAGSHGIGAVTGGAFTGKARAMTKTETAACTHGHSGGSCGTPLAIYGSATWAPGGSNVCASADAQGTDVPLLLVVPVPVPAHSTYSATACDSA